MDYEEKEVYLFLDFMGALPPATFRRKNLFFKMINLDKGQPLVQLDETLYRGTYNDTIGTNVFFEETDESPPEDSLQRPTPIKLKYLLKQTKVLELERVKLPEDFVPINKNDCVKLKFKTDYRQILEKIENGTFRIDDYIVQGSAESDSDENMEVNITKKEQDHKLEVQINSDRNKSEKPKEKPKENKKDEIKKPKKEDKRCRRIELSEEHKDEVQKDTNEKKVVTESVSEKSELFDEKQADKPVGDKTSNILRKLAEQPLQIEQMNDKFQTAGDILKNKQNFPLIKELILQDIACSELNLDVNEDNLNEFVDVETSVQQRVITPSDENPRKFTTDEIKTLLSIHNFENLRTFTKLFVLIEYLKAENCYLKTMPAEKLNEVDSLGYTPSQRHELLKLLANDVAHEIAKKIKMSSAPVDSDDDS